MEYEYGIAHYKHDPNGPVEEEQGPHRTGMTLREAQEWLEEWENYGARKDAFYIIRRPKGDWEALREVPDGEPVPRMKRIRSQKEILMQSIRDKADELPEGPL